MRRINRVAALVAALVTGATLASPTHAAAPPQPGDFRGFGFDQCVAPTQHAMDRWLTHSPFQAVGIYTSGRQRACRNQPNLTPEWVTEQTRKGWRLLPITLDHQPYCIDRFPRYGQADISRNSANSYYEARLQGLRVASTAVASAQRLGIPPGSTLWLDIEGFDYNNVSCRTSTMAFQHGWNRRIRALDYVSGLYSSASSGIKMLDVERLRPSAYRWSLPDRIWIARWDGQANTSTTYISSTGWQPNNRMKQYRGGHNETWGGVTINIDSNWLSLGRHYRITPEAAPCGGVNINFPRYPWLFLGRANSAAHVKALQCLLQTKGYYAGPIDGRYTTAVVAAANRFQAAVRRPQYKTWRPHDWTALFSHGRVPTIKGQSTDPAVRRLQRSLNAALGGGLTVNGVFDGPTNQAVRRYQARRALPTTGVVWGAVWWQLNRGGV